MRKWQAESETTRKESRMRRRQNQCKRANQKIALLLFPKTQFLPFSVNYKSLSELKAGSFHFYEDILKKETCFFFFFK